MNKNKLVETTLLNSTRSYPLVTEGLDYQFHHGFTSKYHITNVLHNYDLTDDKAIELLYDIAYYEDTYSLDTIKNVLMEIHGWGGGDVRDVLTYLQKEYPQNFEKSTDGKISLVPKEEKAEVKEARFTAEYKRRLLSESVESLSGFLLDEATASEIVTNYDGPVSKNPKISVRLVSLNPKTKTVTFSCSDSNGSKRSHLVNVRSSDHKHLSRDTDLSSKDKVDLAFTDGELKVFCSCECFVGETLIKMLDGTSQRIDSLIPGNEYWIYSSDINGTFVPKKAKALGITKYASELVEVILDNGKVERCSLSHLWMLRDGTYREAKDLQSGDSLMPLYCQVNDKGYEEYLDNFTSYYELTHTTVNRIVNCEQFSKKLIWRSEVGEPYLVTHHTICKNGPNKLDNTPEHLEWLGLHEHWNLHSLNATDRLRKSWTYWNDKNYYDSHVHIMSENGKKNNYSNNVVALEKSKKIVSELWRTGKLIHVGKAVSTSWGILQNRLNRIAGIKKSFTNPETTENRLIGIRKGRIKDLPRLIEMNKSADSRARTAKMNKDPLVVRNQLLGRLFKIFDRMRLLEVELSKENFEKYKGKTTPNPDRLFDGGFSEAVSFYGNWNHKVLSVRIIKVSETPLYDLFVPDTNNFLLDSGVFVHNSFLYGGFQYITWTLDSGIRKELRSPVVKNPDEKGLCCKHINGTMKQFKKFIPKIAKAFATAKDTKYRVINF